MKLILAAVVALAPMVAITPLMAKDNEPAQRLDEPRPYSRKSWERRTKAFPRRC